MDKTKVFCLGKCVCFSLHFTTTYPFAQKKQKCGGIYTLLLPFSVEYMSMTGFFLWSFLSTSHFHNLPRKRSSVAFFSPKSSFHYWRRLKKDEDTYMALEQSTTIINSHQHVLGTASKYV